MRNIAPFLLKQGEKGQEGRLRLAANVVFPSLFLDIAVFPGSDFRSSRCIGPCLLEEEL